MYLCDNKLTYVDSLQHSYWFSFVHIVLFFRYLHISPFVEQFISKTTTTPERWLTYLKLMRVNLVQYFELLIHQYIADWHAGQVVNVTMSLVAYYTLIPHRYTQMNTTVIVNELLYTTMKVSHFTFVFVPEKGRELSYNFPIHAQS